MIDDRGISSAVATRDLVDDKSTLVQVMAWCRQATSHYLSQCWPSSVSPSGITRPQWVNKQGCVIYHLQQSWTCAICLYLGHGYVISSCRILRDVITYPFSTYQLFALTSYFSDQGPISMTTFHHNAYSIILSLCYHLTSNTMTATKFRTWHNSCAVLACVKTCCDLMPRNWITTK